VLILFYVENHILGYKPSLPAELNCTNYKSLRVNTVWILAIRLKRESLCPIWMHKTMKVLK